MILSNAVSIFLVIILNLLVYMYMGWEIVQISAYRSGFSQERIYEFVKLLSKPYRYIYTQLNLRPHKTRDFFANVSAFFYISLGPAILTLMILQLARDTSARSDLVLMFFVLLPIYLFFLCSGSKRPS